ncbi:MAG: 16S rRNA (guanine(966)-N(2))-methyltransferase RsmD [Myxococcales bacterium]|nr:16S rRNA (guanine(966)-N(2))-methyltransferase RsmD [Myxococcales bacterium]
MRITGGELRSRSLTAPRGKATRPTSDRVREALFSMLHARDDDPYGPAVLDLYAGTGALALEALSRGAPRAVLVENARPALEAIRANVRALDVEARVEVIAGRVEQVTTRLRGPYGVIFCDPPYADVPAPRTREALEALALTLVEGGTLVLEHAPSDAPPLLSAVDRVTTRVYGDTALTFFSRPLGGAAHDGG